jgi:glutathione S-transferase
LEDSVCRPLVYLHLCYHLTTHFPFRYLLNIRRIPYDTVWIDYPDLEPELKKLGVRPAGFATNPPYYSVPVIYDPKTSSGVSDSPEIFKHIAEHYTGPEYPVVATPSEEHLTIATDFHIGVLSTIYRKLMLPATYPQLTERGKPAYRQSRSEKWFKVPFDELIAPISEEVRAETLQKGLSAISKISERLDAAGCTGTGDAIFLGGASPSFADIIIAGILKALQRVFESDTDIWKAVEAADGGRWGRLNAAFAQWEGTQPMRG